MHVRILNLDGSLPLQNGLIHRYRPTVYELRNWGPRLRMGCRFARYRRFENALKKRLEHEGIPGPALTLYGSGDFHHVSLALLKQIEQPFNLLVIDNHPDWMRGLPFMHCGTWLYHAARLPMVQTVIHVGGDVDFDNGFRWLAPWRMIREGKINVVPSVRTYTRGSWRHVLHETVRPDPRTRSTPRRLDQLLEPFEDELGRRPLYISLDKDVMIPRDAAVNWDSGHLELSEVQDILQAFARKGDMRLAGMDIVGDWSPVQSRGLFRKLLDWTEHPSLEVRPGHATECNEQTNLAILETVLAGRFVAETMPKELRVAA